MGTEHHAFLTSAADTDPPGGAVTTGTVFDARNNLTSVHTGIAHSHVNATLNYCPAKITPSKVAGLHRFRRIGNVEEVTVACRELMLFVALKNEIVEGFGTLTTPQGARHLCISTRDRTTHWELDVDRPTEDALIQTWPTGDLSVIREAKAKDGVWLIEEWDGPQLT